MNLSDPFNTSGQWTAGFTYDLMGNVLTATDANGVTITNTYDMAGRVKTRTYSDSTPAVNFYYDGKGLASPQTPNYAKGKLTRVTSSVSETQYQLFDNLGRMTQMAQITDGQTYTSKYTYNFSGALVEEEYPSGRVVINEFETDGDLMRIHGFANPTAQERTYANSFSYTPDGRIEKLKLGNGLWESAKFNSRLQVTEFNLGHGPESGDLWKLQQEYGELQTNGTIDTTKNTGNIARQTVSFNGLAQPFVTSYKYDSLYRLVEAKETQNAVQTWRQNFAYDRYGNRTGHEKFIGSTQLTLDSTTHPAIDAATNRFQGGQGYVFDKNGNLTTDAEGRTFVFNGDNKQKEVRNASNAVIGQYHYDGEGRRVKKVTDQNTTVFVYSAGKLVAEYSTATPTENPTTKWTVTDQLGSPRVLVDSLGQVVSRRDFMPFGEEIFPDGTHRKTADKYTYGDDVRQKFTGYQKDEETQLDFAEARMYQNQHARFTAVDPLLASGKSANPQTFNRYVYVVNNPLIFVDPDGLQVASRPGPVYTNGNTFKVFENPNDVERGYNRFDGDVTYDLPDGYRYNVTSNGWTNLGLTSSLVENDVSDLEAIGIGFKRMVNRGFEMPLTTDPVMAANPIMPTLGDLIGWKPFSNEETRTPTWRDWRFAVGTELGIGIVATRGATFAANNAPRLAVDFSARGFALTTSRSNGAVCCALDTRTGRFAFSTSGDPLVPKSDINVSMRPLLREGRASGVQFEGLGSPRACCEFKSVNILLNRGSNREDIIFQVIDVQTQRVKRACSWCMITTRGTTGLNGN